ncbi:hypothetical protein [Paracraurococcus lichenis]|uniref:Cation/H+ exchanger domain-containing protein n=1 Tax=Paracraurococcus lichenis TaxID=3064888 RepID=A0ABT9EBP5_9PROT|nr:hypothetical protein [Paracraurococcus sp. LOR1-02]MDO9713626.1 hypothetical protein [Paracraurococcus sp. LOR1-02]
MVEALVFLLTGLQARIVIGTLASNGLDHALAVGLAISATVIVVRFAWVFPATYLPRLIPTVRRRDPCPDWRLPFLVGFTGLRGVVRV